MITMENKMTIMDQINAIAFEGLTEDQFDFLVERARKSVRKASAHKGLTKAQKENEEIKDKILEVLMDKGAMTATQVGLAFGWNGSQKATALLNQMVKAGTVERIKEGRAITFSAIEE